MYDFAPILSRIKQVKKAANMTNEELSKSSGIPFGTINKILSGDTQEPKLPALMAIASALGTSVDYLVYGANNVTSGTQKITPDEDELLKNFKAINKEGQRKLLDYSRDLVSSGNYLKRSSALAG